jgi:hypothetical protein
MALLTDQLAHDAECRDLSLGDERAVVQGEGKLRGTVQGIGEGLIP